MPIAPDDKDWTWVLERACPECGFDASRIPCDQLVPLLLANSRSWLELLAASPDALRRRTRPDRWSPLEYACHVRDVFVLFEHRLQLMLTLDNPTYPNWDQDRTALEERYNEQDPVAVAGQLADASEVLAASFQGVEGAEWERQGVRSDGAAFTVATFGRYMIHDPVHHLYDVGGDLGAT